MNEGAPANDLKKIAAEMRDHAVITGKYGNEVLQRIIESWADALDALAAQSQVHRCGSCDHVTELQHVCENCGERCAAPQPASAQEPAVPEEFAKALDLLMHHVAEMAHENAYRRSADARAVTDKHGPKVAEVHAAVLRLYALASGAPRRPTVSREALVKALNDNHSPDVSFADIAEAALRALGIEVKE